MWAFITIVCVFRTVTQTCCHWEWRRFSLWFFTKTLYLNLNGWFVCTEYICNQYCMSGWHPLFGIQELKFNWIYFEAAHISHTGNVQIAFINIGREFTYKEFPTWICSAETHQYISNCIIQSSPVCIEIESRGMCVLIICFRNLLAYISNTHRDSAFILQPKQ